MEVDFREFTVPASDSKGHSERIWARIQSGHSRQISLILNTRAFPYRTPGDLVRHAIARHLTWLGTQAPVPSVMAQVDSIMELMRDEEFQHEFQGVVQKLDDQVSHYLALGQIGRAKSLITRVMAKVESMPDSEWRDMYRNTINEKYSGFLSGKSVNLRGGAEEEDD